MVFPKQKSIRQAGCLCLVGLCLLAGGNAAAEEKRSDGTPAMTPEQKASLKTAATITAFRVSAMRDQAAAFRKLLTPAAFSAWQKQIAQMNPETSPLGVADFINTAVLLLGPQTPDDGACALYSPFQDVILLMQTDNTEKHCRVENFRFLPGAVFRGEKLNTQVPPESLLPGKNLPLTIALMKVFAGTEAVFSKTVSSASAIAKYPTATADQIRYIGKVMDTRNRCALTLLKDEREDALFLATSVRSFLQNGNTKELQKQLQPGVYQQQAESFAALPQELRQGMELCHWLTSPKRDLYAFMNKLFPRYIAIVTADVKKPGSEWTMEWFDLNNAKILYPLYEKELAKNRK